MKIVKIPSKLVIKQKLFLNFKFLMALKKKIFKLFKIFKYYSHNDSIP
jgi:hypothetical protein